MNTTTANRQKGLSLIGLIFVGLIVVALLALGFKIVPAVIEYIAIERAVQKIKNESGTVRDIQAAFERHRTIDDITSISSQGPRHHERGRQGRHQLRVPEEDPDP